MAFSTYSFSGIPNRGDKIRFNLSKNNASLLLNAISFIDKDTKQHLLYIPSLDISSYGENPDKANEMMRASLEYYFANLLCMDLDAIAEELGKYGWSRIMAGSEFFISPIEIDGRIEDFNAENNIIEHLTLQAA